MASLPCLKILLSGYLGHRFPIDINKLCLEYAFVEECFESVGDHIVIDKENKNIATIREPGIWNSLFGICIIYSTAMEHRWRFKILKKWGSIVIGITEEHSKNTNCSFHGRKDAKNYALQSSGKIYSSQSRSRGVQMDDAFSKDDIVEMVVKNRHIEFFVNDKSCATMKISKKKNYKMAVSLIAFDGYGYTSIELLKDKEQK